MKKQKIVFPEMYFPRLREVDDAVLRLIARSDSGLDEERHFAALKQVFAKQNGYLAEHQDYCPGEVLEWAAYHPERAWAYAVAHLVLLQTAWWHGHFGVETEMRGEHYRRHGRRLMPPRLRDELDEAYRVFFP